MSFWTQKCKESIVHPQHERATKRNKEIDFQDAFFKSMAHNSVYYQQWIS